MTRRDLLQAAMDLIEEDAQAGICLNCHAQVEAVEPDAHGYECEFCGSPEVYGAEELVLMLG